MIFWRRLPSWTRSGCATDRRVTTSRGLTKRWRGEEQARDVELRTDASDVTDQVVRHDRRHGTSKTGDVPPGLEEGCTDAQWEAVRAYVRREWLATRQEFVGHSAAEDPIAHNELDALTRRVEAVEDRVEAL